MISLNGLTLPDSLFWEDRYQFQPVGQAVSRTLDGAATVYHVGTAYGQPITLTASESNGWLTEAQASSLQAYASSPGLRMPLVIGSAFNGYVVFRHSDSPALSLVPLFNTNAGGSTEYYIGTIKLLTVA